VVVGVSKFYQFLCGDSCNYCCAVGQWCPYPWCLMVSRVNNTDTVVYSGRWTSLRLNKGNNAGSPSTQYIMQYIWFSGQNEEPTAWFRFSSIQYWEPDTPTLQGKPEGKKDMALLIGSSEFHWWIILNHHKIPRKNRPQLGWYIPFSNTATWFQHVLAAGCPKNPTPPRHLDIFYPG
jgi:hypothetical protein